MKCPACSRFLIVLELDGVEVDHCPACGGTWLDAGELQEVAGRSGVSADRIERLLGGARAIGRSGGRCPRCRRSLREIGVGSGPEVRLDRCPSGHGLWFDRGEIRTAIRGLAGDGAVVARFFADLYRSAVAAAEKGD